MSQHFPVALLHYVAQAEFKETTDITIWSLNMGDELESAFCHHCTNWNSSSEGRVEGPNDNDEGVHPHPDRLLLTGTSDHQSLINKSVCVEIICVDWGRFYNRNYNRNRMCTFQWIHMSLTIKWYGSENPIVFLAQCIS